MIKLQKIFDVALKGLLEQIKRDVIRKKFHGLGITLTEKQISSVLRPDETCKLELDETQIARLLTPEEVIKGINVEISEGEISEITSRLSSALVEAIPEVVDQISSSILLKLDAQRGVEVKAIRHARNVFAERVRKRWRKGLDIFELYIAICNEAGTGFNQHYRPKAAKNRDFVFDVLTRLQARGCQIGLEVLTLLESGLADGAHARWRTLHELACVAMFVKKHGQTVAERYRLHDSVETYKAASQYQVWCRSLNQKRLPKRTLDRLQRNYDGAKSRFGKSFGNEYGWAAAAIGKDSPRFSDIEKDIGLEKFRPYYRLASLNVHAGARGIAFKLGQPGSPSVILSGASDAGLADPAHGAAISLFQLSTTLLMYQPNIDSLTMCAILREFEQRIGLEFLKSHNRLLHQSQNR